VVIGQPFDRSGMSNAGRCWWQNVPMPDRLSPADRRRFAVEFGVSLPSALIALNRHVREPGTP
jgi:hypothetical protein